MTSSNKIVVAVKGLIFEKGKVLTIKRATDDEIGAGTWEFPGGKIEFGEELEGALVREIQEEVGLAVTTEKLLYATTFKTDETRQVVVLGYLCRNRQKDKKVTLSKEHIEYQWATKEQLKALLDPTIIADFEKNNIFSLEEWEYFTKN